MQSPTVHRTNVVPSELLGAIRRHPIWRDSTEPGARVLCAQSEDRRVRAGEWIAGGTGADRIHLLLEGTARGFYRSVDGRSTVTVKLYRAPACFGDASLPVRRGPGERVEALTSSRVLSTPIRAYLALLRSEPSVCFRQYCDLASRFEMTTATERAAHFAPLRDRVIALLVGYARHFGAPQSGGIAIDYPLTQELICSEVGSNRRSIVSALGELYREGLLLRAGRRLVIRDLEALLGSVSEPAPDLSCGTASQPEPRDG
jgi:CRP-like cAMP-binding protein